MFLAMFEFLFGWRKASTCKKLIRYVQCRLKILKNKRESTIRQICEVIVQLIQNGQDRRAFSRVEQLIKDQNMKDVYDLIDHFCELIIIRLPYIRRHRDCPSDISEAISSLIYASARFGDLPELIKLRTLFGKRYGNKRVTNAVELLCENHVNHVMIEKLGMKSVSDDIKFRVLKEIARENNLELSALDIGCGLALQYYQAHESEKQVSNGVGVKNNPRSLGSPSNGLEITLCQPTVCNESKNKFVGALTIVQPAPYDSVLPNRDLDCRSLIRVEKQAQPSTQSDLKDCRSRSLISALHFSDVQEFPNCETEDIKSPDRRVFIFKLTFPSLRCKSEANTEDLPRSGQASHHQDAIPWKTGKGKTSSVSVMKRKKSVTKRLMHRYGSSESLVHIYSMLYFSRYLCFNGKSCQGSPFSRGRIQHQFTERSYCHLSPKEDAALNSIRNSEIVPCPREIVPCTQMGVETSSLCPVSSSSSSRSHIHPKLPDYDDLVTKFMALKLDHMQGSKS